MICKIVYSTQINFSHDFFKRAVFYFPNGIVRCKVIKMVPC